MKKKNTPILYAICVQLLLSGICYAQENALALKAPTTTVTIDGVNKEWGDDMVNYNADKNLHYTISNDKDNLYLVIKTNDKRQLNNILLSGITFSIDTKGRKKSTYAVTFPVKDHVTTNNSYFETLVEKRTMALATKLRKTGVKGFKDIDEDEIYAGNIYKIQTALNFDDNGYLVYEEAIPLALFKAEELANNEWAYNIKLNAVSALLPANGQTTVGNVTVTSAIVAVPAGSGPPSSIANRNSMQANINSIAQNMGPREAEVVKAIDFWGKFTLAKAQ